MRMNDMRAEVILIMPDGYRLPPQTFMIPLENTIRKHEHSISSERLRKLLPSHLRRALQQRRTTHVY